MISHFFTRPFLQKMQCSRENVSHKMRSAQTPFGAWAIMKKFIKY